MRKLSPTVSQMMMKFWRATVTVHSGVFVLLVLGLLFPPIPLTAALKLNGTTTTAAPSTRLNEVVNYTTSTISSSSEDGDPKTTIPSFLQPEVPETTFNPQVLNQADELTTTKNISPSSSLAKRHSSIQVGESGPHDNNASPRFSAKLSAISREADPHSPSKAKPQRNGTKPATTTAEVEGEQSSTSISSTAEQIDNETTDRDNNGSNESGGASTFANSLGNDDDGESLSLDRDESGANFSGGDEGDSEPARGGGGSGVVEGDIIFPPEEEEMDSDELADATTASLVRPGPTLNPHSFASQLTNKLSRSGGGGGVGNKTNRLGTRGLNSKSELNAITLPSNATTTTSPTISKNSTFSRLRINRRHNHTDNVVASSDSSTDRAYVRSAIATSTVRSNDSEDRANFTLPADSISDSSNIDSTRFDLNGTSFSSRSNLFPSTTHQQFHRARPTQSVIYYGGTHNNNLHNRIIKRKKIPLGRNETNGGSSLSSIYGNSILTSTLSTTAGEEGVPDNVEAPGGNITTPAPTSITAKSDTLLSATFSTGVDATTESNSLSNPSQHGSGSDSEGVDEKQEQQQQSSPPFISGGGGSTGSNVTGGHNLTAPAASEEYNITASNGSTPLSSSRAILGFGPSAAQAHGKVKRPKPIIIRDHNHDYALYVNNLSENSGGVPSNENNATTQAGHNNHDASEETPVSSSSSIGNGEEEANKPVGSNALPSPPFKVRKVKLNSRRASTFRPLLDYEETTSSLSLSPSSLPPSPVTAAPEEPISSTRRLLSEAASGATGYLQFQNGIRPSVTHEPPLYSTRRFSQEQFGITHHSYGQDEPEDDEEGLQGTTEFFPENSRPYPIPVGVRSVPGGLDESGDNGKVAGSSDEKNGAVSHTRIASNADADDSDGDNKYRDYYSEIRSSTPEYGSGNLHVKSDPHHPSVSPSPVTVTVTHTIVETTPQYVPNTAPTSRTGTVGGDNGPYVYHHRNRYNNGNDDHEVAKRGNNPNLHPTPALPSSILASSTTPTFANGQGPEIISQSVENVQVSTSRYGVVTSSGVETTHSNDDGSSNGGDNGYGAHKGNDQEQSKEEMTPAPIIPQPVEPTPGITENSMKSVYFTHVSNPHFTSSSYEFTSSTMYSYSYPGHDNTHHHEDDDEEPHDHHHEEEEPTTSQPEREHNPEVQHQQSSPVVSDDQYFTPTLTSRPEFWDEDDSKNLTKSSSSQVPVTMDQENGGISTQTIDVDVYTPPPGTRPNSKVALYTTPSPSGTGRWSSSTMKSGNRVPGSMEDNEISEEELRKQQGRTTLKPRPTEDADKDKNKNDNEKVPEGGTHKGSSSKEPIHTTTMTSKISPTEELPKTPFGIGESFGIGSVHVPILVQMELDVAQPVFCSHLRSFKEMISTVYETQKNTLVHPAQIVIYTKPSCDANNSVRPGSSLETTGGSTGKAEALIGTTSPPTSRGTYPLTSPPALPKEKSQPQKEGGGKNSTTSLNDQSSSSASSLSNLNKNGSALSNNKSSEGESAHEGKSLLRSRRSTKMAAASKNANISDDSKSLLPNNSTVPSANSSSDLFSVYFYVNNESGSYDQDLTSSFVRLWNETSRLTNASDDNNNANANGDNAADGSSNNYYNEMFIKKVKKVGMITASHLIQAQDPSSDENSGIIVAITVASIIAVCLFALGVGLLIMRHRQAQTKFAKRCTPVTLDDYSLDNISVYNSFRRKQRLRGSKRSYTNAAFDDPNAPSKPLNASQLAAALTDVTALENEFRAIPNITATLDDIPNGAETKNRYANVIPMPDSRVLLTFQEDNPNSDYINANYVRGAAGEPKKYIITQGPLEETIVDFWRMVWEQQIRVVFMLTDFAEGGIAKCAEYYPRSETIDCSQLHGDFQITLEKRDIADNCITSYLVIKDMERNLRRDVVHFWYHSWPEKGVPASPKMTIDFLNRSRKFTKEPFPVLVHCSPGTGRSGTVVAYDIAMKEYDSQNKIDIPQIVMKVRQDRAGAVQTKEQYVHIYEVLHSYVSRIGGANLESI